jgi:hypothetical protein
MRKTHINLPLHPRTDSLGKTYYMTNCNMDVNIMDTVMFVFTQEGREPSIIIQQREDRVSNDQPPDSEEE